MIRRREILVKAIDECLVEMYKWAQPSINLREYIDNPEKVNETDNDRFFNRYYLSRENTKYIVDSFIDAYRIGSSWKDHIDLLINYITNKESVIRVAKDTYEKITPLQDLTPNHEEIISLINNCREFYRREPELEQFNFNVYLGCSPTSNKDTVEKYWREHGKPDFKIEDFSIEEREYEDYPVDLC